MRSRCARAPNPPAVNGRGNRHWPGWPWVERPSHAGGGRSDSGCPRGQPDGRCPALTPKLPHQLPFAVRSRCGGMAVGPRCCWHLPRPGSRAGSASGGCRWGSGRATVNGGGGVPSDSLRHPCGCSKTWGLGSQPSRPRIGDASSIASDGRKQQGTIFTGRRARLSLGRA